MSADHNFGAIEQKALSALKAKLGVNARSLRQGMKRAGRRLPREAHRAAEVLSKARMQSDHPKLSRLIDETSVQTAQSILLGHLDKIDPKERRKHIILSVLGTQAFNVLVVGALVVALMTWRGLL